jgi:hypothetical protein
VELDLGLSPSEDLVGKDLDLEQILRDRAPR